MSKSRHGRRRRTKRRSPPGSAPGTIAIDPGSSRPEIVAFSYGPGEVEEIVVDDLSKIPQLLKRRPMTWVNVDGLGDARTIEALGELFGLHRLALEDVVNTHQRAKVEHYDGRLFIVSRMPRGGDHFSTEQLSMFIGPNFVVTFQDLPGDCLDPVRQRLRGKIGQICDSGPDYLAYALLDAVIDAYYPVLEKQGERMDQLEDDLLARVDLAAVDRIHELRRQVISLRRAIWPHREALLELVQEPGDLIRPATRLYLRDCLDHVAQLLDLVESDRELATDLRELYLSTINWRLNETMQVLTVIATIFIPLTFVAGVYGMNFKFMPELELRYGYWICLAFMALLAGGMYYWFKRRGWIAMGKGAHGAPATVAATPKVAATPAVAAPQKGTAAKSSTGSSR